MMDMRQRQQLAHELEQLRQKLLPYEQKNVKELPDELQKRVRSYRVLGSITSSGLEYVASILGRLVWASHYLTDPGFPANYKAPPQTAKISHDSTKPAPPADPIAEQPLRPMSPSIGQELDFGPFDPRKSNA